MKLKELLEVIPENYEIGLANFDKENLIQAVADCQNALDSMVYLLLLDRDAIKKKIEEADERAERLYRGKV